MSTSTCFPSAWKSSVKYARGDSPSVSANMPLCESALPQSWKPIPPRVHRTVPFLREATKLPCVLQLLCAHIKVSCTGIIKSPNGVFRGQSYDGCLCRFLVNFRYLKFVLKGFLKIINLHLLYINSP